MMKPTTIETKILLGFSFIIAIYFTCIQLYYHETYNTFAWDLGIFLQSLESFVFHGKLFYNTVELPYNPCGSYFGIHFSPILLLFAIPYAIYPHPLTLFLIKNLLICLTSPILYKIGREQGLSKIPSALIAISYLFFVPLYGPLTFDFHPYSILPFFISSTHLYVIRQDYKKALLMTIMGLSTNEISAVLYVFYALGLLIRGLKKIAKQIICISMVWFLFSFILIFNLNPTQWKYYLNQQFLSSLFMMQLSDGAGLSNVNAPYYLLMLYGLLLFLPLLSLSEGLLAVSPWLLVVVLTNHLEYSSPYYQYTALISAQLFLTVMTALKRFRSPNILAIILVTLNVCASIILGPVIFGTLDYSDFPRPAHFYTRYRFNLADVVPHNKDALDKALNTIPKNASVFVQTHLFPHLYKNPHSYVSLIPGVNGWPIIYVDLGLKSIEHISIFSALNGERKFIGDGKPIELIFNGEKISLMNSPTKINLERPTKIKELYFRCQLILENTKIPQTILSSEAFEIGVGTKGYLILLIHSDHNEERIKFSDSALKVGKLYELEVSINQNGAVIKANGKIMIELIIKNRIAGWIMKDADYIIIDSSASVWNFRIGNVPLILDSEYRPIAAGDGVIVFSRTNSNIRVQNLTESKYIMFIYANDEPVGEPVITMPLSELKWKFMNLPLVPQCLFVTLRDELVNVSISGSEEYAFANLSRKAYSADSIKIRCSAVIRGKLHISGTGHYVLDVKIMIPSTLEIRIDNERVNAGEPIYLSAGDHNIEIIWRMIRYPILNIEFKKY